MSRYNKLQSLRSAAGEKVEELSTNLQELKTKLRATEGVFSEAQRRNKEMKVENFLLVLVFVALPFAFYV